MPEVIFQYAGCALNADDFRVQFDSLSQDDRGFEGCIKIAIGRWRIEVCNYFFRSQLIGFCKSIRLLRDGQTSSASIFSFDEEIEIFVLPSPTLSGAIGIGMFCGESAQRSCFFREFSDEVRRIPQLVLSCRFIELDNSYLETIYRDIGVFLASSGDELRRRTS